LEGRAAAGRLLEEASSALSERPRGDAACAARLGFGSGVSIARARHVELLADLLQRGGRCSSRCPKSAIRSNPWPRAGLRRGPAQPRRVTSAQARVTGRAFDQAPPWSCVPR